MDERLSKIAVINSFIHKAEAELTLVLQNLQWDRQEVLKGGEMVLCDYDKGHRIPASKKKAHAESCYQRSLGYSKEDEFLPDPPDPATVIKFDASQTLQIIESAARVPNFKKGSGTQGPNQPLTVDRLQATYSSDERRAIHDAVVAVAPTLQYIEADINFGSGTEMSTSAKVRTKSHAEVLAELRDMKRRRTKYRVVSKSKNYSDVLRDVIQTQMELYTKATSINQTEVSNNTNETTNRDRINTSNSRLARDHHRYDRSTYKEKSESQERDGNHDTERNKRYIHREESSSLNDRFEIDRKRNVSEISDKLEREEKYKKNDSDKDSERMHHKYEKGDRYRPSNRRDREKEKHRDENYRNHRGYKYKSEYRERQHSTNERDRCSSSSKNLQNINENEDEKYFDYTKQQYKRDKYRNDQKQNGRNEKERHRDSNRKDRERRSEKQMTATATDVYDHHKFGRSERDDKYAYENVKKRYREDKDGSSF